MAERETVGLVTVGPEVFVTVTEQVNWAAKNGAEISLSGCIGADNGTLEFSSDSDG